MDSVLAVLPLYPFWPLGDYLRRLKLKSRILSFFMLTSRRHLTPFCFFYNSIVHLTHQQNTNNKK